MNVYWLFLATLVSSFFGYRLAVHYRLNGMTGLIIALSLCVILGTNAWRLMLSWLLVGDHLVTASGTLLTVATLFAFVEKYKFVAILKITSMLFPVSFASVSLPHVATSWDPDQRGAIEFSLADFGSGRRVVAPQGGAVSGLAPNQKNPDRYYAKVSQESTLYLYTKEGLVKSSQSVEEGTWVLAGHQVAEASGRRWINVMLPDSQGNYVAHRCPIGYIPSIHLKDKTSSRPSY